MPATHLSGVLHVQPLWQHVGQSDEAQQVVHVRLDGASHARVLDLRGRVWRGGCGIEKCSVDCQWSAGAWETRTQRGQGVASVDPLLSPLRPLFRELRRVWCPQSASCPALGTPARPPRLHGHAPAVGQHGGVHLRRAAHGSRPPLPYIAQQAAPPHSSPCPAQPAALPSRSALSALSRPSIAPQSALNRPSVGPQSALSRPFSRSSAAPGAPAQWTPRRAAPTRSPAAARATRRPARGIARGPAAHAASRPRPRARAPAPLGPAPRRPMPSTPLTHTSRPARCATQLAAGSLVPGPPTGCMPSPHRPAGPHLRRQHRLVLDAQHLPDLERRAAHAAQRVREALGVGLGQHGHAGPATACGAPGLGSTRLRAAAATEGARDVVGHAGGEGRWQAGRVWGEGGAEPEDAVAVRRQGWGEAGARLHLPSSSCAPKPAKPSARPRGDSGTLQVGGGPGGSCYRLTSAARRAEGAGPGFDSPCWRSG
jgi:hypothetical protein